MRKFLTTLAVMITLHMASPACAQTMIIHTVAGNGVSGFSGDGGPATAASFDHLADVAVDAAGNLYLADELNHRIRKVNAATGIINTIAGTGLSFFGGDGGPATAASFSYPTEMKLDGAGNIYIVDYLNNRLRKINAGTGIITTIAGGGTSPYYNGMVATSLDTSFRPEGLGVDAAGNCYFLNAGAFFATPRILRLDAVTGTLSALVDSAGAIGFSGDGGPAVNAKIDNQNFYPGTSAGIDGAGNVYITDINNHRIRVVNSVTGTISTIAGNGGASTTGDGGPATAAGLGLSYRIAINSAGDIYFFDYISMRKIDAATQIITTIGGGGTSNLDNIPATAARFYDPYGIAVDAGNNVYYADNDGFVRMLTPACTSVSAGTITNAAGPVFCDSANTILTLTAAAAGLDISYQWQSSADGITWVNTGTNALSDTTGKLFATTYYKAIVTCITGGITDTTAVDTITITPSPSAGVITGIDSVCPGHSIALSDTATGGVWSSSNSAIATVSSAGIVTGVATGNVMITYTVQTACTAAATLPVRVLQLSACTAGVETIAQGSGLKIYPNPNTGVFSITLTSGADEDVQIIITDLAGRKVKELATRTNAILNIELKQPAGIYLLSATYPHENYKAKLVITQ